MIPLTVLVPLVTAGGLAGLLHERIRHKRPTAPPPSNTPETSGINAEDQMADGEAGEKEDLVRIAYSERAAKVALGMSVAGILFYPPLGLASVPVLGYAAFHWLRTRYPHERPPIRSAARILALLALTGALATGHWVLAALVLTADLSARKWTWQRMDPEAVQAPSPLSRRSNWVRVALFLLTNIAVLLLMTLVLALFGVAPSSLLTLAIFAFVFGMSGSFISLALSKWVAKLSTGARVIEEPETDAERWLIDTVARHARRAGVGMPEVAVYDSFDMNAFATGMRRDHALVAVSTGLLARMTPEEIEAVLGHELTHVANGDMVTMALLQGVLDTFVIFISRVIAGVIDSFTGGGRNGGGLGVIGYWVVVIALQITLGFLATLILMWFSRQREFRADAGGAELAGREEMIAALERLRFESERSQLPDRLAAFGIHSSPSRLAKLLSDHPPIEERIAALLAGARRPAGPELSPGDDWIEAME